MKKDRLLIRVIPGIALIMAGLLLSFLGYDAFFLTIAGAVAIGMVLLLRWRAGDQPEKDERTNKLGAFSLAYSYLVSLILALVLFISVYLGMVVLDAVTVLQIIIYIMTVSAIAFMLILNRRADVWGP
ncbi:MAG: hypothetical protein M0Q13_06835 [Methanothrix sp.]|jgi:hypothetical protein|nr:hypothetical protein [Methanothrix sp.]